MKEYFLFELKLFIKKKKTALFVLALLIFLISTILAISIQGLGDEEKKLAEDLNQTRIISRQVQNYNADNEAAADLSEKLYLQQNLIASQSNGITFNDDDWFIDSGIKLAELRHSMLGNDLFKEMPDALLPQENAILIELVGLEKLQEQSLPVQVNLKSATGVIRQALVNFGYLAFAFVLLFGSDIAIDDFKHKTMVESYPVTPLQRIYSKLIIYSFSIFITTILTFLLVSIGVSFAWGTGSINYPIGIYLAGHFNAVPIWQHILLFLIYYFILIIHTLILTMLLNRILKNSLATMLIGLVLFIIPYLYPPISSIFMILPFPYYNTTNLFSGRFATTLSAHMDIRLGIIILSIYACIMLIVIVRNEKNIVKENKVRLATADK